MNKIPDSTNRVWVTHSTSSALTPTAAALGKFDGLHRGHQRVIQPILNQANQESPDYSRLCHSQFFRPLAKIIHGTIEG